MNNYKQSTLLIHYMLNWITIISRTLIPT